MIRQVIGGSNIASNWNRSHNLLSMAQPGSLQMMGSEGLLPGWLDCKQQLLSIAAYEDLFKEIGFTWGSGPVNSEQNTITIPNLVQNVYQTQTITAVADVAGSLNDLNFYLSAASNQFQSLVTAAYTQPVATSTNLVAITFNDTSWMNNFLGSEVYIGQEGNSAGDGGYYYIYAVLNSTTALLHWTGSGSVSAGNPVAVGSTIVSANGGGYNVVLWNNVSGGGTAPINDSCNKVEVDFATGSDAPTVAAAIATAINSSGYTYPYITAVAAGPVVTLTYNAYGPGSPAYDSPYTPTGYTFGTATLGSVANVNAPGLRQIQTITTGPDVAGSLNNTYSLLVGANTFYSQVTAPFIQPVVGGTVTVEVTDTSWMIVPNANLLCTGTLSLPIGGGYYMNSVVDATHVVLYRWDGGNAGTGTTVPAGQILVNNVGGQQLYCVWNNISGGGTNPDIDGFTSIEVDSLTNDTAATIAQNTANAINTEIVAETSPGPFGCYVSGGGGNVVNIVTQITGTCTAAQDSIAVPTGFAFGVTQAGTGDYLDGKGWIMYQSTGSIGVYLATTGHTVIPPNFGTTTYFLIGGQARVETNDTLASNIAAALQSGLEGLTTYEDSNAVGNVVTLVESENIPLPPARDVNTGYAFAHTIVGGATEFYLPPAGVFFRSWDQGNGNDPDAASRIAAQTGGASGDNVGSYQGDENAYHYHYYGAFSQRAGGPFGVDVGNNFGTSFLTYPSGGNESRPTNVYVMYMIKY